MKNDRVPSNGVPFPPERVLLVDDNPTNLQILYHTLNGRGYRLLIAKDGHTALAIARKVQPALILLDIMMPGMDGFEVCQLLQENTATRQTAVIFLSALGDTESKIRGFKLGAVDYITKPFQSDEIIARVETHLKIHRLQQTLARQNRELATTNEQILQAIGEGVYGLDTTGKVTFANPAAIKMTGYEERELIGKTVYELHLHTKADGLSYVRQECPIPALLSAGQNHRSDSEIFWRKDMSHFPVEYTITPIHEGNNFVGTVMAFRDISERKRNEKALQKALSEVRDLKERLQAENTYLQHEIKTDHNFGEIIGESTALASLLREMKQVAPTDTTVLIHGESGTGKELIARAIHSLSPRRERPLIKVNCGAISANLVESELFGHEKGAFTGATKTRTGYFELADSGTIFLDECGELPLDTQVKLLRVLQEHEFKRVGGNRSIRVDVRVIAATNRDLLEMVDVGSFRLDLYYRLSVFPLTVPPLRERVEDIPILANFFVRKLAKKLGKPLTYLSDHSIERMKEYDWPGNIRELQNVIERASILTQGSVVEVNDPLVPITRGEAPKSTARTIAANEYEHILSILQEVNWIIDGKNGAAAILDIPSSTLRSRMKKLGIRRPLQNSDR